MRITVEGAFSFVPGQYATLGVETGGRRLERPYSMCSSPYESELEFFFELVPGGEVTPEIYQLQPGDELSIRKSAKGRFTLDRSRSKHLLVATVTGVAPFVSFVRTLHRDWREGKLAGQHELFLVQGASRSWEFGYDQELRRIASEVPWLKYVPTVSRPWEDEPWRGETGRVDDVLRKYTDLWGLTAADTMAYLCGHPGMVEHSREILARIGFSKENWKEEAYWVAKAG